MEYKSDPIEEKLRLCEMITIIKDSFDAISIEDGQLPGYDSDVMANDELLIKYLSRNKDTALNDIVSCTYFPTGRTLRF